MPPTSMWIVRLAIGYLVAGATIGGIILAGKAIALPSAMWLMRPFHIEFLLFGWMVQIAFGVATWILPRIASRYSMRPVIAAAVLLNAGIWMVGGAGVVPLILGSAGSSMPAAIGTWLMILGRLLETSAFALFAYHIWPRVRAFRG